MDTWKTSGHSDLFALRTDGKFCAFELKTPEGKAHGYKATGDQLQFLAEVQERNGIAKVVYSLEDIWNP